MTTNQEGVHAAVRDITGTARSYNEDWHALFDADGIATGTFNERMLGWINATLSASYTNLNEAMQAFAVEQGFANWASMNTFVAGSEASTFLRTYGPYGMVMSFADDASIEIDDETDALDFSSSGQVDGGALVGPGAKTTYSAPSLKLTEQSDGVLRFQAHNLFSWSEDVSNAAWLKTNVSVSGNVLTATGVSANKFIRQNVMTASGPSYEISFDVAAGTHSRVQIYSDTPTTAFANFNLSTGTVTLTGTDVVASVTAIGGGVYRCTAEFPAVGTNARLAFIDSDVALWGFASASTGTIVVLRAHLRRTPSQPDYIKTTGAAAYDLPYVWSGGVLQSALWEWTAATNLALRSNDFTNASWTLSNMTTALTATGPDGVANGASTLTATAANATALQAITSASSSRLTSVYIKRRTGSGNIDLTQDNGTTWTTQTVTSSWTRVALAAVTSTNPTVGIRIVTSGDAVDVWCFQHETGTVATSPIITYGAAVARVADSPLALLNLFPSIGTAYTIYAKYKPQSASVATTAIRLDDTTTNELVSLGNNSSGAGLATVTDGGVSQVSATSGTITSSAFHRVAASVEANNVLLVVNGGAAVQDTSVTLPTLTRLLLGGAGGMELAQLAILPGARTEAQLQALGA